MNTAPRRKGLAQLDYGRLAMAPLVGLLLLLNIQHFVRSLRDGSTVLTSMLVTFLTISFYVLVLVAYFRRSPARATSRSNASHVAAVVASWLPFTLPVFGRQGTDLQESVGSALLLAGLAWSVWSLRTLGRSFSVLAQAREVIRTGPYRVVRHPLYLGEMVGTLGMVVSAPSTTAFTLWVALLALQVYRMHHEENVLTTTLPDYASYRVGTHRLVPYLY